MYYLVLYKRFEWFYKKSDIPQDALLVTADVVELYPSILHEAGLKALKEALDKRGNRNIATNDLIRMAEFVLKNSYFQFNGQVKQQMSGIAIGTKFAPTYACIFVDDIERKFLKTQSLQPLIWSRCIDDVFFKCKGKLCEVCLNVQKTSYFSSSVVNETYKINHQFDCNEKYLETSLETSQNNFGKRNKETLKNSHYQCINLPSLTLY